jgi:hypothetical protein
MMVFAHVGHWLVDLLYVAPLILMAIALLVGKMRERRTQRHRRAE